MLSSLYTILSFTLALVTTAAAGGGDGGLKVLVFGDSQGDTGPTYKALQDVLDRHNVSATVRNKSVGGTLACGWAKNPNAIVDAAHEAFKSAPDLVWYTAGANDLAQDSTYHSCLDHAKTDQDAAACIAQSTTGIINCTETLLEHLWSAFPDTKVGQYNYDMGCINASCIQAAVQFLGGSYCLNGADPKTCVGKALQYWQTIYVDQLQKKYPFPRYTGMNVLGTVQKASGVAGAQVGNLVLGVGVNCDWEVECVHPKYGTPAGTGIADSMWDLWLSKLTNQTKAYTDDHCTDCLKCPGVCKDGLKCETGDSGGICTKCTGQYESPCGDKCCLSGQECHQDGGDSSCDVP